MCMESEAQSQKYELLGLMDPPEHHIISSCPLPKVRDLKQSRDFKCMWIVAAGAGVRSMVH